MESKPASFYCPKPT